MPDPRADTRAATGLLFLEEPGPLTVGDTSMMLDPQDEGAWFNLKGCLRDGEDASSDVMITEATPSEVGGGQDVTVRVAWNGTLEELLTSPGEPPGEYRPVGEDRHSGGTLTGCSVSLALVLPAAAQEPVTFHGLDIIYVTDGQTYTTHSAVDVTLCPSGTHAGVEECVDRRLAR